MQNTDLLSPELIQAYRDWLDKRATELISNGTIKDIDALFTQGDALKMRHLLSIGGTAAAAIYGANPYRTAMDVYKEMTGEQEPFKGNYITRRGQALEKLVAIRAAELMRAPVFLPTWESLAMKFAICSTTWTRVDQGDDGEQFDIRELLSLASCQIDALIENHLGELVILECKTASRNPTIKGGGRLWGKGIEDWTANGCIFDKEQGCAYEPQNYMAIPYHYYIQVQWQLLCLKLQQTRRPHEDGAPTFNYTYAYLAADIAGSPDVRVYIIYQDEKLQQKLMDAAASFMLENVMTLTPPLAISYAAAPLPTPSKAERAEHQVTADADFLKAHREYSDLLQKIEDFKEQAEQLKGQLVARMDETEEGLNEVLNPQGELLLKRTTYKRTSFDQKALRKDHPDIYHEYAKTTEQTRVTIF